MKNQKGITLIALVITIIVLIILAGVSIAMLSGENGLLTKAKNVGSESAKGNLEEATKLAVAENLLATTHAGTFKMDELTNTVIKGHNADLGTVTVTPTKDVATKTNPEVKVSYLTIVSDNGTSDVTTDDATVYVTEKGAVYSSLEALKAALDIA